MPKALLFARFRLKLASIALIGFFVAVISADLYRSTERPVEGVAQHSTTEVDARVAATTSEDRERFKLSHELDVVWRPSQLQSTSPVAGSSQVEARVPKAVK